VTLDARITDETPSHGNDPRTYGNFWRAWAMARSRWQTLKASWPSWSYGASTASGSAGITQPSLIERFGRNETVLNVSAELTSCPKQRRLDVRDLCQARWSDTMLVALYGEEPARQLVKWRETSKRRFR
jgi:hypothetical protein